MSVFRQVIPSSSVNASTEAFEYMLMWLSPGGIVRQWLFSHVDGDQETDFENTVIESEDSIRSVPTEERIEVDCRTQSLDPDTFDYVKSLMASNRVYQVYKDFSRVPIAVKSGSVVRENKAKEFGLRVKFSYKEEYILNA